MSVRSHASKGLLFSKAESLLAPHPNVFYGQYPVKKQKKTSWLDAAMQRINKLSSNVFKPQSKAHRKMLRRVHASHKIIETLSDAVLDKFIIDIKCQLHRKGLKDGSGKT